MQQDRFEQVIRKAAAERGCTVVDVIFNDDDNIFEVTIDKAEGYVEISDCEYVHRAVLAEFDRNIEDYSLTVGSLSMDAAEADELLNTIKE